MPKQSLAQLSQEALEGKLKSTKAIHWTIIGIFGFIIFVWLLTGYWYTQLPIFASTLVMAAACITTSGIPRMQIEAELKRRRQSPTAEPQ